MGLLQLALFALLKKMRARVAPYFELVLPKPTKFLGQPEQNDTIFGLILALRVQKWVTFDRDGLQMDQNLCSTQFSTK